METPEEIRPAEPDKPLAPTRDLFVIGAAIILFGLSWLMLHHGPWATYELAGPPLGPYPHSGDIPDTSHYQLDIGSKVMQGQVPYKNFALEYPPGSIPVFAIPAIGIAHRTDPQPYRDRFELEMLVCGILMIACIGLALVALGETGRSLALRLGFAAISPLLLGVIILTRFDLWPSAFVAAALAAILFARNWLSFGLLAGGVAAKIFPGLLLPVFLLRILRREGQKQALAAAQIFVIVSIPLFLPFVLSAPSGVLHSIWGQLSRPVQIESLASALLITMHNLLGTQLSVVSGSGSQNVVGTGTDVFAPLFSLIEIVTIVGIWVWFARGEASEDRFLRACAGSFLAFLAIGKVLSPQYMIWLVPVIVLLRGKRRPKAAIGLLALALLLTQYWFPYRYWNLAGAAQFNVPPFQTAPSLALLLRDLTLLALLAVVLWPADRPLRRRPVEVGFLEPGGVRR